MQKQIDPKTQNENASTAGELPVYFRGRQEQATYADTGVWRYQATH